MNIEEQLKQYKVSAKIEPEEIKIRQTISKSKEAFYRSEQDNSLSYLEFLWSQMRYIKKRWWGFQLLALLLLWVCMYFAGGFILPKSMGITASLFVVMIIPELWKNRTCQTMDIEGTSYFSLRQIYAARMLLFAMIDVVLLSLFCGTVSFTLQITMKELLIQFLLPMSITACICFQTLCMQKLASEFAAVTLCLIWSAVWALIVLNEAVYTAVSFPIWLLLFTLSVLYLCTVVYRTLKNCNHYWEVNTVWN